jgi:hypothetical protein
MNYPLDTFAWQRKIARAELPLTTKSIAMLLAYFANADGSRVRPGERLLAAITGLTERAVRRHLALLRELCLIERVEHGNSAGRADVYQLTVPAGAIDTIPMRLNERWQPLPTAADAPEVDAAGTAGTGTQGPVDNSAAGPVDIGRDRTPVTGSASSLAEPHRTLVTPLPEPGGRFTGHPVPPTNQTIHHQPSPGSSQVGTSLDRTPDDDGGSAAMDAGRGPGEAAYASARRSLTFGALDSHPGRAQALEKRPQVPSYEWRFMDAP